MRYFVVVVALLVAGDLPAFAYVAREDAAILRPPVECGPDTYCDRIVYRDGIGYLVPIGMRFDP
jgi:hypothetical protein